MARRNTGKVKRREIQKRRDMSRSSGFFSNESSVELSESERVTGASKAIPHFAFISRTWKKTSPLPWDVHAEKEEVANAATFLLGPYAKKITGQVLHVDGGASIMGGELLPMEREWHYDGSDEYGEHHHM